MSTRTLTPDDPHAPRERRRFLPWSFLVAAILAPALILVGINTAQHGGQDAGALLILVGVAAAAYGILGGPIYTWGPSGILLTFGVLVLISGLVGVVGVNAVETATVTMHEGDDDRDGLTDEDDYGDADNSANDPTKVSGVNELLDHEDDDADGRVDEDPAPVYVTRPEVRAGLQIGRDVSAGVIIMGFVLIGVFYVVQNGGRQVEPAPRAAAATAVPSAAPVERGRATGILRIVAIVIGLLLAFVGLALAIAAPFGMFEDPEVAVSLFLTGLAFLAVGAPLASAAHWGARGLLLGVGVTLLIASVGFFAGSDLWLEMAEDTWSAGGSEEEGAAALSAAGLLAGVIALLAIGLFVYLESRAPHERRVRVAAREEAGTRTTRDDEGGY